jgi:hypothetical protein
MHPQDQDFANGTSPQAGPDFGQPEPGDEDVVIAEVVEESASDVGSADGGIESDDSSIKDEEFDAADEHVAAGQNSAATSADPILSQQWRNIQSAFVDDPRAAVCQAAEAADAAITALAEDLRRQMSDLADPSLDESDQNTEHLRIALQRYRVLWQGVQDLAGSSLPRAT